MDFKDKVLKNAYILLGSFLGIPSPPLVEMLGHAGYDFVILDIEHGTFGIERMEDCVRAAAAVNVPCVARIAELNARLIQQALDIGAVGVQIPQVETGSQAYAVVQSCRFAPAGTRGYGSTTRAAGYGFRSRPLVRDLAHRQLVIGIQIESQKGVENLADILETKGLDVIFIGTSDLSMAYGYNSPNDPAMLPLLEKLVSAISSSGKVPGLHITDWSLLARMGQLGVRYFTVSATSLIWDAFTRQVKDFASMKKRLTGQKSRA